MEATTFRFIFGPVLSGRLGRSLGLDLLGARICSMNCVYCESGALERLTVARAPYVAAEALLAELEAWEALRVARAEPLPDVVTLGGMGEPTLNSDLPRIIAGARRILPGVPVAVLTNASLMPHAQVRAELAQADLVLPSLDSLVPEEFARINRGHPGLDPKVIAEGILIFRKNFTGSLCLEILLVAGVNDSVENLELLAEYCNRLQPDRVDVVTLSRPGTEPWAEAVDGAVLARWRARLGGFAKPAATDLCRQVQRESVGEQTSARAGVARCPEKRQEQPGCIPLGEVRARILASLARRPQTAAQLASALLASPVEVQRALDELLTLGLAEEVRSAGTPVSTPDNDQAQVQAEAYFQARS